MSAPEPAPATVDSRDRVCAGAYECIARFGLAKTTVDAGPYEAP